MSKFPPELAGVEPLLEEYAAVEREMSDPDLHSDQSRARRVGRRYAELGRVAAAARAFLEAQDDLEAGREMAAEDPDFAAELPKLQEVFDTVQAALIEILTPRDPDDARDVIMEIKAGEGGEESALFAGDLMRMYQHYAEKMGWAVQILGLTESDLGGVKDAQIAFKAKGNPTPEEGVWAHLKYEGGVHRVQRVPVTESQGRIHTSAAGVLVMPEAEETGDIEIDPNDLRIDVYRSSGPGGQSVNTTDSAVRITHIPTGIVVSMQNEKSQLQNKEAGMRVLRSRLMQLEQEKREAEAAEARASQVRTVDRSERIRTYNFPENRIADHRTGYKAYNLDAVLNGELAPVIQSAIDADEAARLAAVGEKQ
ncbi:peptide chain release factor 1 [Mobiluncus mulieris]|uniref:Peptide chain release factor 1 n=1 Tax=Mobiluncus mulieris TaxID=2052 RepID=A0A7Y0U3K9_9ACTO|nr:peptide chain release factor 1 [Mobiluncus mulieris]MCU9968706.1 peptide chain release factor 1 [Mobiluncus mulieris]MCU9973192.1 peptide chain release factor 1 [Mobiluncus mulieris]MCV0008756.1 peptide chain release factor 1 [Mobiluncus mulieris]NMW74085.1 peptide chain release factor 1 [Mobiluncus mulieris]NMX00704.1 peptide chain release factor 1 [Mobiluncus mulieris]